MSKCLNKSKKVIVVGAGVGGLSIASRLAYKGYDVEVYEKLPECGGRAHMIEDRGFKFDTGPSFVLMPDFFEEAFAYCGQDLKDYLDLKTLDVSYKIFYADGATFSVYEDSRKTKAELEKIEPVSTVSFERFIEETTRIYKKVKPLLYGCFTLKSLFSPRYWALLGGLRISQSYWQMAKSFFKSDKLCYAFTFEAMFMGVSPFNAPAFYSVISYTDHVQKIRHPIGGMYEIPKALEKMGQKLGVKFHYNAEVKSIAQENGVVILETEREKIKADKVVINADYAYAQSNLLKRRLPNYQYSCSVYLIYLGMKKKINGLEHHNLFFANDLNKNLREVFQDKIVSMDPSFYIHVPTVTDPSLAPPGKDILYILVPVPNLNKCKENFLDKEGDLRKVIFERINKKFGINVEDLIEVEHKFYPEDFISRYNIKYGATFGLSHNLMQSAFFRPANFDSKIKNIYFVGASTQPGGGLPPVLASARIVADLITKNNR